MCCYKIVGIVKTIGVEVYKSDDDWTGLKRYIKIEAVSKVDGVSNKSFAYTYKKDDGKDNSEDNSKVHGNLEDNGEDKKFASTIERGRYIDITDKEIVVKNMELFNFIITMQHETYMFEILCPESLADNKCEGLYLIKAEIRS